MKYGTVRQRDVVDGYSKSVCGIVPFQTNWQARDCDFKSEAKLRMYGRLIDCINKCNSLDWCTQITWRLEGHVKEGSGKCNLQSALDDISDPPRIFRRTADPQSICMTFKNYQFFKAPHQELSNAVFLPMYPSEVKFFLFLNFLIIKILIFLV